MRERLTLFLLITCLTATAQRGPTITGTTRTPTSEGRACLTDALRQRTRSLDPTAVQNETRMNEGILRAIRQRAAMGGSRDALTIPVAVHIVHQNGLENISNAQVIQGIQDLNDAFNNEGAYAQPDGVVTGIHFCLAQQDWTGQFFTGISREESPLTNVTPETDDPALKQTSGWFTTNSEYLNIWLVREITSQAMGAGVAGYAYLPEAHGSWTDGIVNEARWFGSSADNSKIHIHEVGHYLGLYHTFEGGCPNTNCQLDGDRVCDTPPDASTAPVSCGASVNTCASDDDDASTNNPFRPIAQGGLGDRPDLFRDYMDYGFQPCQQLFTAGQSERMISALTTVRSSLLASSRCESACDGGYIQAAFSIPAGIIVGVPVVLINTGLVVPPHSFAWYVDDVLVSTDEDLTWTFTTLGNHTIRLRAINTETSCFVEHSGIIEVGCDAQATFTVQPLAPDPGGTVTFTAAPSNATTLQWWVNGTNVGQGTSFIYTLAEGGDYHAYLIATNGACADTSASIYIPVGSCATGENNTWILSGHDIISFNSGGPVSQEDATSLYCNGFEGLASISDRFGNMLMYTDGQTLFNAQHDTIAYGLGGGLSSSQAALIIAKPGSSTLFYVFTTDDQGLTNGGNMNYTEVDMSLNNGAGGAVGPTIALMDQSSEKLTAVRSCNGEDIWVIGMKREDAAFHSFKLNASGSTTTPVISYPGFQNYQSLGCMKASPKGNKLAVAFYGGSDVLLFDLDNATGEVSVPVSLGPVPEYRQYGVEFSPDGSKLYVSNADDSWGVANHIYQFDLSSGIPEVIRNSRTLIGTSSCTWSLGSLQLAPNDRIYCVLGQASTIGEIREPNLAGTACNYVDQAIPLNHPNTGFGCSNFLPSEKALNSSLITGPSDVCADAGNVGYHFTCSTGGYDVVHHGPNTMLPLAGDSVVIDFTMAGSDTLFVTSLGTCSGSVTDTLVIRSGAPFVDLGNDTLICSTAELLLDGGNTAVSYAWQNGSTARYFMANTPGTYSITVTGVGGCTASDNVVVTNFPSTLNLDLGADITACAEQYLTIHGPAGYASYLWTTNATTQNTQWFGSYGLISLRVSNALGCTDRDTVNILPITALTVDLGPDGTLCPGQVRQLGNPAPTTFSHQWQDGSTASTFTAYAPGTYTLTVNGCGYPEVSDTVVLLPGIVPLVDLGEDIVDCGAVAAVLGPVPGVGTRLWSSGTTGATYIATEEGTYWLAVTDANGCYATDTVQVFFCVGVPLTEVEGDITLLPNPNNGRFTVILPAATTNASATLFDAQGRRVLETVRLSVGSNQLGSDDLATGVYMLRVEIGQHTRTYPLIVQRQ